MNIFFGQETNDVFVIQVNEPLIDADQQKLVWLFDGKQRLEKSEIIGDFIGPRAAMVTPWSTNAVEITENMGIQGILRIERFITAEEELCFDPMLMQRYHKLDQDIFTIHRVPDPVLEIEDIATYNVQEGLSLNTEEIDYLHALSQRLGRRLTDSEVFGFSQVNSEHCRHKIFNGTFVIDGVEQPSTLFELIKKTSKVNPQNIISAYKDNVAFVSGTTAIQFAPILADQPSFYEKKTFNAVFSLKAETHNFPTTVEPFSGAATGAGGEIRDRMAGGKGSIPSAGTAVYMTSYSRLKEDRPWEKCIAERPWMYQTPLDILIKASNGASDFGNKFGQPLICGSLLTFEHEENDQITAFDKVIMLAGGIGYAKVEQALKKTPQKDSRIIVMGGDNYRIGMGGAAVSSADTGQSGLGIELNAVQRSNPEMQKRVANAIRALVESEDNPIVSIHDHGAGGHLNCLSELVESSGGIIDLDRLPLGDPTLSAREIIGNESQERMGLVIASEDLPLLERIALRERAPLHNVGIVTDDHRFVIRDATKDQWPMNLALHDMFGNPPKTILEDSTPKPKRSDLDYDPSKIYTYLHHVLRLEAVACKDWLTNKVDRCVGGRVAKQQCVGPLQLPLNNCGVMAIDFDGNEGIATSIGHAPGASLINPEAGARLAIVEALTNLIWAPLKEGIRSVSLSANWMWPCRNQGEDARLYQAVLAVSDFACALGINIPTGKDSLSMKQKYKDRSVISPGTVVISSIGHCTDHTAVVEPLARIGAGSLYYIDLSDGQFALGGSSLSQTLSGIGIHSPDSADAQTIAKAFNEIQGYIKKGNIKAGHDIGSGGLITTLLELFFAQVGVGANLRLDAIATADDVSILFSEGPGLVVQSDIALDQCAELQGVAIYNIGEVVHSDIIQLKTRYREYQFDIPSLRDAWYETSFLLDQHQTAGILAKVRYDSYHQQALRFVFPSWHTGVKPAPFKGFRPIAAILREKGSNSEREMAHALYLAGWNVRDVHMTDIISGREKLDDVRFLGAVGGFSNSDVLGSAKGWAGSILYNEMAKDTLDRFFAREDVLSIGICNGCQLFMELDLINPHHDQRAFMTFNDSLKHESAFTSVVISENTSVMLGNLAGSHLGVWISHGEGKFVLPEKEDYYHIVAKYGYDSYPANPNGSDYNVAMLCSHDGRHLVTMPHIERSIFRWNWAYYPMDRSDKISPWIQAFINAREWVENNL